MGELKVTCDLLRGGELEGVRLLGPRTVAYMTRTTCPAAPTWRSSGGPVFAEVSYGGMGFGLGLAVVQDPVKTRTLASAGEFSWGGAASTVFWVGMPGQHADLMWGRIQREAIGLDDGQSIAVLHKRRR